jgi:tripeptide aminopeptidase
MKTLSALVDRFLRYCRIDTQADPASTAVPSTEKQKDLARLLTRELEEMGARDVQMDRFGYVTATLPGTARALATGAGMPVLALFAHMDTSPDAPGAGVTPIIHEGWDGSVIALPGDPNVTIDPARQPALLKHIGEDLITSDGTTLLGSDDKAGVAVLMQMAADWPSLKAPLPETRLCFTIDEEIGRGVENLDLAALGASIGYTIDGSGVDTISFETFNAAVARISISGVGVHPGYAKGILVNALRILAELVAMLPDSENPESTEGREGYYHAHSVGKGGADKATIDIILRDFSWEGLDARKQFLRDAVEALSARYPKAILVLEIQDNYRNMRSYIEGTDPRAVSFAVEAAREIGISLEAELVRGGTDGARLSEMGLPTPNIFNGGHDYHSCFEWNTVQSLERTLVYVKQLVGYWGRSG